ncbi:grasp-with-spasm system ATP-grasp peptide maturase [Elizabethkingia ursingii]|uniref:Grasp-with-spasm system ATP-grasp peptide maturase n=1 Tax=Elizabethkingia ursingii TaxID=1756150 RepID=A0ABX3N3Z6_9FLAO|nr:grasp-with-spasm system ATP-grasp peptide maturase [Elizabethkingia ursingii]OPB84957.1 grasp-with-spasm system ATP-grasp peptide maturase [Elizabethkingia ursingii]
MILLISQSDFEYTTDIVYEWVKHLGGNVQRINGSDLLDTKNFNITFENGKKQLIFQDINVNEVNVLWFRRWISSNTKIHKNTDKNKYLRRELYSLTQYLFSFFSKDKWYNNHSYFIDYVSKTEQLIIADKVGFFIPETLITNNKKELKKFVEKNQYVITKSIGDIDSFYDKKTKTMDGIYTSRITLQDIEENIPEDFFPSLFQKEIKKKMEIRVFYDKGECFSMAIISGNNPQTEVDFRQYDYLNPNRNIPFQLTEAEENNVKKFMKEAGLETGSLDFIYTYDNQLVFLEVNPVGQFGMVSSPCNYYLEKRIAENLIKIDHEEKICG